MGLNIQYKSKEGKMENQFLRKRHLAEFGELRHKSHNMLCSSSFKTPQCLSQTAWRPQPQPQLVGHKNSQFWGNAMLTDILDHTKSRLIPITIVLYKLEWMKDLCTLESYTYLHPCSLYKGICNIGIAPYSICILHPRLLYLGLLVLWVIAALLFVPFVFYPWH